MTTNNKRAGGTAEPGKSGTRRNTGRSRAQRRETETDASLPSWPPATLTTPPPETGLTGGYLILMREDKVDTGVQTLERVAGLNTVTATDANSTMDATRFGKDAFLFDDIGVAVVDAPPEQIGEVSAMSAAESGILAIEPERVVYPAEEGWFDIGDPAATLGTDLINPLSMNYLKGYQDAINHLVDGLGATSPIPVITEAVIAVDESELTWGLQITNVAASGYSGRGIRIAVLDTGFDLGHPDFAGRSIVSETFVPGEDVQDGHGHGTHCVGTACGPKQPGQGPRYGIATEAEIFVGKVLSNRGSGADRGILAGISWAIRNRCAIVSMSLGAPVLPGQKFSEVFETTARRALQKGTLIVAAAGNNSARPASIRPVSHPANCPSIMAVAAVNQRLQVAGFSDGGVNPGGGEVDIAAPGVDVRSSWPRPILYDSLNGTSMATPHVAGIAALVAEANPNARGAELASRLLAIVRQLSGRADEVGRGLVQAP